MPNIVHIINIMSFCEHSLKSENEWKSTMFLIFHCSIFFFGYKYISLAGGTEDPYFMRSFRKHSIFKD
jgi:hypothetical protein